MAEGSVGLQGDVEILVAERDIRSQQHFRCGLAGNIRTVVLIYPCAVAVHLESGEVRHVEHAQRLSDSLEHHVVVAVESGTVHRGDGGHRGCQHLFAFIVAAQREQLVLRQRQVGIDGQHHVAGDERCAAEREFHTAFLHRTHIGHQLGIFEGRYADRVGIEHVVDLGVIVVGREHQPALEHLGCDADVERSRHLPFQVGIAVLQFGICGNQRLSCCWRAVWLEQAQCGVAVDGALISGPSQSGVYFQVVEDVQVADEFLLAYVPANGNRREVAPLVVVAELR